MVKILKSLNKNNFYLNEFLLSIIFLPYLSYLYFDYSFNIISLLVVFIITITIDYLFKNNYNAIFLTGVVYVLYSVIAYDDTLNVIQNIRFRTFSFIILIITFFIIYLVNKTKNGIKFLNTFIIFFVLSKALLYPFSLNSSKENYLNEFKINEYEPPDILIEKNTKPVILIILDGLSSSDNLFEFSNDSLEYKFDKDLKSIGFNVFPKFKTDSVWTKYSLPSLFNFNLHDSPKLKMLEVDFTEDFNKARINSKFSILFKDNLLIDSLIRKKINIKSYGHVTFTKSDEKLLDYYLWNKTSDQKNNNLIENFAQITVYGFIKRKLQGESIFENSRQQMLDKLINLNPQNNTFYYFHFYAPHDPFTYFDEFKSDISLTNTENYIEFRRFFLNKLFNVLMQDNLLNSRIIITGDHGFRYGDSIIDQYLTSLYLRGYEEIKSVDNFNVQDMGYFINESF